MRGPGCRAVRAGAAGLAAAGTLAGACPPAAIAAITYIGSATNGTSGAGTLVLSAPTGVATGQVEIATLLVSGSATITPPSGWTKIIDTQNGTALRQASFWHVAGATEGTTTWTFGASTPAAGGILAYSGVDTTTVVDAAAAQTGTSTTSVTAPSVTDTYAADVLLGLGATNTNTTFTAASGASARYSRAVTGASGPSGLAEDQTLAAAGATTAQAMKAATSAGATIGTAITLKAASAAGVLAVQTSAAPGFSASLDSGDQSATYTLPLTTTASVSPAVGWNETITSTQFSSGAHSLPASASTIGAAPSVVCNTAYANCKSPTNTLTYPVTVPADVSPPTAVKFFNAASGTGSGSFTITPTITVQIPQNGFAGSYSSTVTVAIASGP